MGFFAWSLVSKYQIVILPFIPLFEIVFSLEPRLFLDCMEGHGNLGHVTRRSRILVTETYPKL